MEASADIWVREISKQKMKSKKRQEINSPIIYNCLEMSVIYFQLWLRVLNSHGRKGNIISSIALVFRKNDHTIPNKFFSQI